jgi:hypothetical protein
MTRTPTPTRYLTVYPAVRPALPGLNSAGLGYVRDDMLARAAAAEQQGADAEAAGNRTLADMCAGESRALRGAAENLVRYALHASWQVDCDPAVLPTVIPAA